MSTYILAFAIGPFVKKQVTNEDGTLIRIWGWTGQEEYLEWAAHISAKCMHVLANYTDFPYPYIKSDQLGMPEFVAGAMENYGLIIYKYQYITFSPKLHSTKVKEMASETICHELSHQWFGDTVTMAWWDDLFLNEGMATFFETFSQKLALPEQVDFLDGKFLTSTFQAALTADANVTYSHPLFDINGPFFDGISYSNFSTEECLCKTWPSQDTSKYITYKKGGSMLNMINSVLGSEVFQRAIRDFIKTYQFSNAKYEQLFQKFTEAASSTIKDWCGRPMNVSRFLEPWFLQQSFPLVTMTNNQPMADSVLSQEPYNSIASLPPNNTYKYEWPIPLFWKDYRSHYLAKQINLDWLIPSYDQCPAITERLSAGNRAIHWNLGNADSRSFVRIQYDDIGYARLLQHLKARRDLDFTTADKVTLIGDHAEFAARNDQDGLPFSYKKVLELITTILPKYPHYATFRMAQDVIDKMERLFMDGPDYPLFQEGIRKWLEENYNLLGYTATGNWDNDMARYLMLPYAVRYDIGTSAQNASRLFQQFLVDCAQTTTLIDDCSKQAMVAEFSVHPDVRIPVYCAGVRRGSQTDFDKLLSLYDHQEKYGYYYYHEYYAMLQGLSCTPRRDDIMKVIPRALKVFRMPPSKKYFVPTLFFIVAFPEGSQWMAEYLEAHSAEVMNSVNFDEYLDAMTSTWFSQRRLDQFAKLQATLAATANVGQKHTLQKYYNKTSMQVVWWKKHFPDISRIFYDNFNVGPFDVEYWLDRLPQGYLKPTHYNIKIRPYFPGSAKYPWYKNLTVEGTVDIGFTVLKTPTELKLNAHRMVIEAADIILTRHPDNTSYQFSSIQKDFDSAFLIIPLATNINMEVGSNWTLSIKYTGFIYGEPTNGVYLNTNFFEFNGKMTYIFSTFFEKGPSARSLVPCFDEPSYKATWQLSVDHPADMIALANMPDEGFTVGKDGWATTFFPPTPPMSSYLFAIAVGHFASFQTVSKTGVLVRAWAWTGMEKYAELGVNAVAGTVDFMATYFDMPYTLPKLDAVALPQYNTLRAAMEHWGVMHFQYEIELADPQYATGWSYLLVASVCAHEVVHQWFGDLVTTEFFNRMFLNEAMAQYWETYGMEYAFPEQKNIYKFERFRRGLSGFSIDSSPETSKPVVPNYPKFSTGIIYNKGATLLHMLSNTLSPEILQLGLQTYLKRYQFSNTVDAYLWAELTQAAATKNLVDWNGKALDVRLLMDPWIYQAIHFQATYPVLKVTCDDTSSVTYSQEPFIIDAETQLGPSNYSYRWPIPVFSQTAKGIEFHYFTGLDGGNAFWKRPLDGWQVENAGFAGFFRVWYDQATWNEIYQQLKQNPLVFDVLTRAQFVSDAVALRERGSLDWARVLDIALILQNEQELAPWYAFVSTMNRLINTFDSTESNIEWKLFQFDLYFRHLHKKFCENLTKQLDGERPVIGPTSNIVPPDVRHAQYCWGTYMNADENNVVGTMYRWFEINSKYFERDTDKLLEGQACTRNQARFTQLITDTLSGQFPAKMLTYLGKHDETGQRLWQYFEQNWREVSVGAPSMLDYMNAAMTKWKTQSDVDQANNFLNGVNAQHLSDDDKQAIRTAVNTARERVEWITNNKPAIVSWLKGNVQAFY
ncbi:unnamed protein product [Toxocara canis]|uniref:Aminopeptidase N n=1 Tax=Toxocara canis TaxID=6265 RepID=A0A183UED9_TOXCA|nr:unnamed protein product [Toxocara canis]